MTHRNIVWRSAISFAIILVQVIPISVQADTVCEYGFPPRCDPGVFVTVYVTGVVTDARQVPVSGASVSGNYEVVQTNSLGKYRVRIRAADYVTIWAWKDLYEVQSVTVDPYNASVHGQNFTLPFELTTSVSPAAFNSTPKSLSFETITSAPLVGTRVLLGLPGGSSLQLTNEQAPSTPVGYTRWIGTTTVESGTADGRYWFSSCALDDAATGSCGSTAGIQLSSVKYGSYVLDTQAPIISTTFPSRLADVFSLPNISATWVDPLSGVSAGTLKMWIDGSTVSVSASGNTVSASGTGIPPGVHLVEVEATDVAGNTGRQSFVFTLSSITSGGANASLVQTSVDVNPTGAIPPPQQVRFTAPSVDISGSSSKLNASTRVGLMSLSRSFTIGQVDVVFQNETGLTQTVTANIPASTDTQRFGVLSPSATQLRTEVPAHQINVPNLTVAVPAGFNTSGSTATLLAKTVLLSSHLLPGGEVFKDKWPKTVSVVGSISRCMAGNGTEVVVQCRADSSAGVFPYVLGTPEDHLFIPVDQPIDGTNFGNAPTCFGCTADESEDLPVGANLKAGLAFGCPTYTPPGGIYNIDPINLCSGVQGAPATSAWTAYLNAWAYNDSQYGRFPLWQQNRSETGSSSCPNTSGGTFKGLTRRLVSNAHANDGSSDPIIAGTYYSSTNPGVKQYIYLGKRTGSVFGTNPPPPSNGDIRFQLSNSDPNTGAQVQPLSFGTYLGPAKGYTTDGAGNRVTSTASTTNGWESPDSSGTDSEVGIVTGTEFRAPQVPTTFDLSAILDFQVVLDFTACNPWD